MADNNNSKISAKVIIYVSIFSFFVVLISLLYIQSINIDQANKPLAQVEPYSAYGDLELGYDPLVTVVPEELQDLNAKSEIFISSVDPKIGTPDASVIITLFGDITNPNMPEIHKNLEEIAQAHQGQIMVIWKDYVLPEDPPSLAQKAAEAAQCMAEQGEFWDYFGFLVNNQDGLSESFLKSSAKDQQINYEDFVFCLDKRIMKPVVEQSYYYAGSVGVDKSPILYINNEKIESDFSFQNLDNKVKQLLDELTSNE